MTDPFDEKAAAQARLENQRHAQDLIEGRAKLAIERYVVAEHAERLYALEAVKDYGQSTIKGLITLNGGAILATLTFIGALFSKSEPKQFLLAAAALDDMVPALCAFGVGVLLAVVVSGIGYLNFSGHAFDSRSSADLYLFASAAPAGMSPRPTWLPGFLQWTTWLAVGLTGLSAAAFLAGAVFVVRAFGSLEHWSWVLGANAVGG